MHRLTDRISAATCALLVALIFLLAGCKGRPGDYRSSLQHVGTWPQIRAGQPLRVAIGDFPQGTNLDDVRAGIVDWSVATGGKVQIVFVGPNEENDIIVAPTDLQHNVWGWTHPTRDCGLACSAGQMEHAEIYLDTQQIPPQKLRSVARHETGHALGILDHSPSGGDVMRPLEPYGSISGRDLATLAKIYQSVTI